MTQISGHCLNSVFGSNAADLSISLIQQDVPTRTLAMLRTNSEGRFAIDVDLSALDEAAIFHLVADTGQYFRNDPIGDMGQWVMPQSLVCVQMPDHTAHYHFSMAFTPSSFTVLTVVRS